MIAKRKLITSVLACLLVSPKLVLSDTCLTIKAEENSGLLVPGDATTCNQVRQTLKASGRFPSVFPEHQTSRLYPGICFVSSQEGIHATLGQREVLVQSISAWTIDYKPFLLAPYFGPEFTESMASVISQWTITDVARNRVLGKVYTTDAINLNQFSELDVIVGGTDRFLGARGEARIDSFPNPDGTVNLLGINGSVCIP
jgi:hypothetical protein